MTRKSKQQRKQPAACCHLGAIRYWFDPCQNCWLWRTPKIHSCAKPSCFARKQNTHTHTHTQSHTHTHTHSTKFLQQRSFYQLLSWSFSHLTVTPPEWRLTAFRKWLERFRRICEQFPAVFPRGPKGTKSVPFWDLFFLFFIFMVSLDWFLTLSHIKLKGAASYLTDVSFNIFYEVCQCPFRTSCSVHIIW